MARLFRVIILVAVGWAAWHAGMAAWRQFQFTDEVEKIAQFGPDKDAGSVMAAVVGAARRLELPVTEKDVRIRQETQPVGVYIDVTYTVRIQILPRYYYPWTFKTSAHGWFVPGGRGPVR